MTTLPTPRPVFIGGCPRSGTTLLGALLGHGPRIVTVPEATFTWDLLREAGSRPGQLDRDRAVRYLTDEWRFRLWQVSPTVLAGPGDVTVRDAFATLAREVGGRVGKPDPEVWVDHTPANVKFAHSLTDLHPDARIVNLVRDGRGVAASVMPLDWGPNTVVEAGRWWATHVAMGLAAERALGPQRVLTVRYEDLLREPEATLARVCHFAGLPFHPDMLGEREYEVQAYTAHQHRLVSGSLSPDRAVAWRTQLRPRDVEVFEHTTGELLAYLGYPLDHGSVARPATVGTHVRDLIRGPVRAHVVDRARRRWRRRSVPAAVGPAGVS